MSSQFSIVLPQNCEDVFSDPAALSGNYTIDPDNDGPGAPFTVFCDLLTRNAFLSPQIIRLTSNFGFLGSTIVYHDKMEEVAITQCNSKDCFALNLTYQATNDQLLALTDNSASCTQIIEVIAT